MRYISTKGHSIPSIEDALFSGTSTDGGLVMPESIPEVKINDFSQFLSYQEFSHQILLPYFAGSSVENELEDIVNKAFNFPLINKDYFEIAPLREQPEQTFESLTTKVGRANVENTAKRIFKETEKKPFIFLDNITALTVMQEKEGADWVELVQWLNRLRAQDYGVIFMHHGTKAGDTSSGSNLKERSIDISIHLSIPEDEELLEIDEEKNTQIKIQFDKWREFNFTKHSKPFIAVLNRDTTKWSHEPLLSKKQREVKKLLDQGLSPQEIIKKTKISQATVYRIIKQLGQEIKEEKKDEKFSF